MKRTFVGALGLSLVLVVVAPALPQGSNGGFKATAVKGAPFRAAAEDITASQLKDYLSFVASDEMEGRVTPSRGLDTTARFIATLLGRWGVKPAGDNGSYFQEIVLKRDRLTADGVEFALGGRAFVYGTDLLAAPVEGTASGRLVFAGDGWYIKARNVDAYEGLDPKGKIVILSTAGGLPRGIPMNEIASLGRRGEDWIDPVSYAQKKGAVGVIVLVSSLNQSNPDVMKNMRQRLEDGSSYPEKLPRGGRGGSTTSLPTIHATSGLAQAIFAGEAVDSETILKSTPKGTAVKPFALSEGKVARFSVKTTPERISSQNVVAIVEGSDPALKSEYVAFGAHYDHSGTRPGGKGDTILNGADDDGSGTVALMAIAEALQKAEHRPKRSALFVWHMGEEMGLWGSNYFTSFPTVPIEKIVAQLNIDMIGRSRPEGDTNPRNKDLSGPDEVYVIGSKMMSTELGALNEAVNDEYLKLSYNYKYDDPKDPERFFYRSDHIHYARKGIPIVFYFTGVHEDYHQPGDEVSKIDFPKFEKITRTIFATYWEIAEMNTRLKVDKELPAETTR